MDNRELFLGVDDADRERGFSGVLDHADDLVHVSLGGTNRCDGPCVRLGWITLNSLSFFRVTIGPEYVEKFTATPKGQKGHAALEMLLQAMTPKTLLLLLKDTREAGRRAGREELQNEFARLMSL